MKKTLGLICLLLLLASIIGFGSLTFVKASSTSEFGQTITSGTLTTDIQDSNHTSVANPSVAMSSKDFSFDCQAGASASTGTFGTDSERIYVSNPDAADNGWTLTLAPSAGSTAAWENAGATESFDFNDGGGSTAGCGDGGDTDGIAGQMTVDPSSATLTLDCETCTVNNISLGSSASYEEGTTDSITLLDAASASDDIGRWYLTGTSIEQTIPAEQAADTYNIDMTLTVTAK
jgi:hypothetical protein